MRDTCASVKGDLFPGTRDLFHGKRDLVPGKRDLVPGKRDLLTLVGTYAICGCVGVWVCGYVGVWMWVCTYTELDASVCGKQNVLVCQCDFFFFGVID